MLSSIDVAKTNKVATSNYNNCKDETVERSLLVSKNLTKAIGYLTFKARLAFIQLRKTVIKALIVNSQPSANNSTRLIEGGYSA